MKKIILAVAVAASILVVSCQGSGKDAKTKDAKDSGKKTEAAVDPSYAFGIAIGNSIKETGVSIKYDSFLKGVKDVLENKKASLSNEEAQKQIQDAIMAATAKKAEDNIAKEKAFFEKNGKEKGVVTTASGLQYQVITEGTGATPKATTCRESGSSPAMNVSTSSAISLTRSSSAPGGTWSPAAAIAPALILVVAVAASAIPARRPFPIQSQGQPEPCSTRDRQEPESFRAACSLHHGPRRCRGGVSPQARPYLQRTEGSF